MKKKSLKAIAKGEVLKENSFETKKGIYKVKVLCYNKNIFLQKQLNNLTVEIINLTELANRLDKRKGEIENELEKN